VRSDVQIAIESSPREPAGYPPENLPPAETRPSDIRGPGVLHYEQTAANSLALRFCWSLVPDQFLISIPIINNEWIELQPLAALLARGQQCWFIPRFLR
jgi:hypothetical protein